MLSKRFNKQTIILSLISSLFLWSCTKEYKFFDTKPTNQMGKPKIRFVNLHFNRQILNLNISEGKIIKELRRHELSAYEDAPDYLYKKTSFTVTDSSGAILLQDTLSIKEGSNYTFYISPAYKGQKTDFQQQIRYMFSLRKDAVSYALIADPILSSLPDRANVRQVSFSPAIVSSPNREVLVDLRPYFFTIPNLGQNNASTFIPEIKPADFLSNSMYVNFGYSVAEPRDYNFYWGGGILATGADNNIRSGRGLNLSANQPVNFQSGKSYTVITNGTVGESNDIKDAADVIPIIGNGTPGSASSSNPLKLVPIPYEVFILDDADGTSRTLAPLPISRLSRQVAIVNFINLNYKWSFENPSSLLRLNISGTIPPDGRLSSGDERLVSNPNSQYTVTETKQFGDRTIGVVPEGLSRPELSTTESVLTPNGKYFAFHYIDKDNKAKLKLFNADTTVFYDTRVKVNFANFSPDIEPVSVINSDTKEVLLSELKFADLSRSIELPVERTFIGFNSIYEKTTKLAVIRSSNGQVLFEIDLSPDKLRNNVVGKALLFNLHSYGGQRNSAYIYTVIFSGKYSVSTGIDKFQKNIFCFERADKPTFNYEEVYDWQLSYALLP